MVALKVSGNAKPVMGNFLCRADRPSRQSTTTMAVRVSKLTAITDGEELKDVITLDNEAAAQAENQSRLELEPEHHEPTRVDSSRPYFCPVFVAGTSLIGYDHQSKCWSRICKNECLRPTPELDFVSPRVMFDGPLMLLVWKTLSSEDDLLMSNGLLADVRTGEYEPVEFLQEDVVSEDPGVDPYVIRLFANGSYQIVTLYVNFVDTCMRVAIHGAKFGRDAPHWESKVWYMRSDFYESSFFLSRCSAYVDGNLLCLCRASGSWQDGNYILWRFDLANGSFHDTLIKVPHAWRFNEGDLRLNLDSELMTEVEPLECGVLSCGSRILLLFFFRVGAAPVGDKRSYLATVRVHEILDLDSPDINGPCFMSMSPLMKLKTNGEREYMSTTFVSDNNNFIYICPNYNSEKRDEVVAFDLTTHEWSKLPDASSTDLEEWKCWGETPFSTSYHPEARI